MGDHQPTAIELQTAYERMQALKAYRHAYNRREEVKERSKIKSNAYYYRNRERILEQRKQQYENDPQFKERIKNYYYSKKETTQ